MLQGKEKGVRKKEYTTNLNQKPQVILIRQAVLDKNITSLNQKPQVAFTHRAVLDMIPPTILTKNHTIILDLTQNLQTKSGRSGCGL